MSVPYNVLIRRRSVMTSKIWAISQNVACGGFHELIGNRFSFFRFYWIPRSGSEYICQ